MGTLGFQPYRPEIISIISSITEGSAAEKSGLQVGDKLIAINGETITTWQQFVDTVVSHPDQEVSLKVNRDVKNSP